MAPRSNESRKNAGTRRRIVAPNQARTQRGLELDDQPFALIPSKDRKWIFALVPYGVRVLSADLAQVECSIDLPHPRPSLWEDEDHQLWIGGHHLYKAHAFSGSAKKVGTKLSGFVDEIVGLTRDKLLLGVGDHGEVLLCRETLEERFRRQSNHAGPFCATAIDKEKALLCHGQSFGHIVDLNHLEGYTQLGPKEKDDWNNPEQAVTLSYRSEAHPDHLFLAAKDGAIAWTGPGMRLESSLYLKTPGKKARALALFADSRWLYVLREGATLHRYLLKDRPLRKAATQTHNRARRAKDPLPRAQKARLPKRATAMTGSFEPADPDSADDGPKTKLVLGCGHAQGQLGMVLSCTPSELEWENLELGARAQTQKPESKTPNFQATRHRFSGAAIQASLGVDEILGEGSGLWVTGSATQSVLERSVKALALDDVMPQDSLLLAAMLRFSSGIARPGWVYWSPNGDESSLRYFVWGDTPRGWTELATPSLREQKWSRSEVFPLQVALRTPELETLAQAQDPRYARLSPRWSDAELFAAMAKECRQRLLVLW